MATKIETLPGFALGDRVQIKNYAGPPGKIIELRGPLGPKGVNIFRVAIPQKPGFVLIEVRGDQLERILTPTRKLAGRRPIGVRKAIKEVKRRLGSLVGSS